MTQGSHIMVICHLPSLLLFTSPSPAPVTGGGIIVQFFKKPNFMGNWDSIVAMFLSR